jgi:hypothetical protein
MITPDSFIRVASDVNGNPRYVCHYTWFNTPTDSDAPVNTKYSTALVRAKAIGGKRYHTKSYGGGVVFQCFNLSALCKVINTLGGLNA